MTTGSQGEPMSALTRLSVRDHKLLSIVPGDTVVISATPIPGNEKSVGKTINNLYRLGANVIHGSSGNAHVSGHASQEELFLMLNLVRPRYFMPVHGEYRMLVTHGGLAEKTGVLHENVHRDRKRRRAGVHRRRRAPRSDGPTAATSWSTGPASATSAKRCCATASISRPTAS